MQPGQQVTFTLFFLPTPDTSTLLGLYPGLPGKAANPLNREAAPGI